MLRVHAPPGRVGGRDQGGVERPGRVWVAGAIAAALVCVGLLLVPYDSTAWTILARGSTGVAVLVSGVAVQFMDRPGRAVWLALVAYQTLTWVGDIVYDVQAAAAGGEAPFPGWADPVYVAAYACAFAGLYRLMRRLQPARRRGMLTGSAVLVLAASAIMATFVLAPMLDGSQASFLENAVAVLYPLLDLAILALLIRLLSEIRAWTLPLLLVALSFAALLVADIVFNVHALYVEDATNPFMEMLFAVPMFLLTLAVTAPGASRIARPINVRGSVERPHMLALSVGAVTVPLVMLYAAYRHDSVLLILLAGIAVASTVLVLSHLRYLLATVQEQADQLRLQARTDVLTGLPNRRTWEFELERAERDLDSPPDTPVVVGMLDLDRFKVVNDELGHEAGDALLAAAAAAWRAALPEDAFLARYGGEEFALLLRDVGVGEAERLVRGMRAVTPDGRTFSAGLAQREDDEPLKDALRRADLALYRAKAAGRDRIEVDEFDV